MGLDMYLEGRKRPGHSFEDKSTYRMEDGFQISEITIELGYWRKHPNLHGFIVQTFAEGKDECQEIELDAAGLRTIIKAVQDGALPHTEGFFFGSSSDDLETRAEDVNILSDALKWVEACPKETREGWWGESRYVVYRASW